MYKFIQKNQKKFLAIFAVGLMVVFVLPSLPNQADRGSDTAFHLGDEKITMTEGREAADDWQALLREVPQALLPSTLGSVGVAFEDMREHPELFLLLQKEATRLGLQPSDSQVDERVQLITQFAPMLGQPVRDPAQLRRSLRSLSLVQALFDRAMSGIKPSDALVTRELARNAQRVKLDLVHYATEDFAKDVPAPTAEQLQKHFDEYRNTLAGTPTEQNRFGFGYMVPNQVKLLYLTVPRDEVAKAVRQRKSDFDWRVEAMLQYRANPSRFPVTQPAETQPGTQPSTAAASRPTTRPFEEVQGQIIDDLIKPEVDRKLDELVASVADRMRADFEARQRKSAGAPEDFGTLAYLQRIKADVQQRHGVELGVELGVAEINEPKSVQGLRELGGIGQSFTTGGEPFAGLVMDWAEPFVDAARKAHSDVLSIGEPSRPLRDPAGNAYVFQLREATAAHPPADLAAVKDQVEADLRTKLAFELATAAARKLEAAAAAAGGLEAAAKAASKDVFTTPGFLSRPGARPSGFEPAPANPLPGVDLPPAARERLLATAFELLERGTPDKAHPTAVTELPAAGRVVVAELADVEREWTDAEEDARRQQAAQQIVGDHARRVLEEHFAVGAVKQRLGYRTFGEAPAETAAAN
jgi:hypothetical protein